ncbi:MAG: ATP-binding cassette domain-containing protein [Leptolyngbyaceae cyanobacterium bins.349]|nr:ATP-binding cassette domain-containing protein [Leptolyngbyaceae cyanobacterium bins.349]
MMEVAATLPQIRVQQVCLAPMLFRSMRPKQGDRAEMAGHLLLQDVSFEVFPGDRLAIVGASGAGKTTLLRILNRLSEPTTGTLFLHGNPYPTIPVVKLRQQIVYVLQESKLLGMTVQEALAYPLRLRGVPGKEIEAQVREWLERLRIPLEWRDRTEQQLSVGQRQLVAIARALVTQPPVLLLDEPTSALDVGRIQHLFEVLTDLSQRQQMTIVMVNHQLDLAQRWCDRVLYLQHGQLLADKASADMDWSQLEQHLKMTEQTQTEEWM